MAGRFDEWRKNVGGVYFSGIVLLTFIDVVGLVLHLKEKRGGFEDRLNMDILSTPRIEVFIEFSDGGAAVVGNFFQETTFRMNFR